MAKTVKADGEKIQALRIAKGWSQDDLANVSGISVKTVSTAERGGLVLPCTLNRIARALDEDISKLFYGVDPMPAPRRKVLTITIEVDEQIAVLDEATGVVTFLDALNAFIQASVLEPKRIKYGSLFITVELTKQEFLRLIASYCDNKLQELGIRSIRMMDPDGELEKYFLDVVTGDQERWYNLLAAAAQNLQKARIEALNKSKSPESDQGEAKAS